MQSKKNYNIPLLTDSYKQFHAKMEPVNTEYVYSYFESRDGAKFPYTMFFGLQALLKEYLVGVVVTKEDVDDAENMVTAHMGNHFNRARWDYIVEVHGGKLPVEIRAVPEGMKVPTSNVLMTVVNTDPQCAWLTNHLETLLTHVWSASTVATLSSSTKDMYKKYLNMTCDAGENFGGLPFMLHDFGMRGVSSMESAGFEGMGHLINFLGTDTIIAMEYAERLYGATRPVAFSVPASEHSIMTALGRSGEPEIVGNLLNTFPDGILSLVGDSYDIYNFAENIIGTKYHDGIMKRNGKVVVRPDSGDASEVSLKVINILWDKFGGTVNKLGFKVLDPHIGLIWGDGIDKDGIEAVLNTLMNAGYSVENMVFGQGGGLLQKVNRDTQRFAFKSSAQCRSGVWHDIFKDPIDSSKKSKRGRLALVRKETGELHTLSYEQYGHQDILVPVFRNGVLLKDYTFDEVRANSLI